MKVLFIVNGLGLGNSTRCHAIIQHLFESGADCSVVTSGNGVWYFREATGISRVIEIGSLEYGSSEGRLSVARTLAGIPKHVSTIWANAAAIRNAIDQIMPDAIVTDSAYFLRRGRHREIPMFAVNNSDVVHACYRRFRDRPWSIAPQFYAVEELDFAFHRRVPDVVLSPSLTGIPDGAGDKFLRVGPIVRRGFGPVGRDGSGKRILVMLSGSKFSSPVALGRVPPGYQVDIVGRAPPPGVSVPEECRYHGKIRDIVSLAKDADLLVVNGGFSAVSEAFVMHKPVVVIPVPNHAEQWVNGRVIQDLGVGMMATMEGIEPAMAQAIAQRENFRRAYSRLPPAVDGARAAAQQILAAGAG